MAATAIPDEDDYTRGVMPTVCILVIVSMMAMGHALGIPFVRAIPLATTGFGGEVGAGGHGGEGGVPVIIGGTPSIGGSTAGVTPPIGGAK